MLFPSEHSIMTDTICTTKTFDESAIDDESLLSYAAHLNALRDMERKKIMEVIKSECTEENIRKNYVEMESKEITYDPKLYSVVATEALGIHRRLLKLLGTDVIRLKDPEFIQASLQIMLDKEEAEEREAEVARRRRGEESEWNVKKTTKFVADAVRKSKTQTKASKRQPSRKSKIKGRSCMHYDHRLHSFEVPVSKYKVSSNIWEEDDLPACVDEVSLLFENADTDINDPHLPKINLHLRRTYESTFDGLSSVTEETLQESNNAKEGVNNSSKRTSPVKGRSSSLLKVFPRKQKKRPQKSLQISEIDQEIEDLSDGEYDPTIFEPQAVNSEEKKMSNPFLENPR